jgi:murein DD-endopeptidase MepM/ murein hydrolase activator NlpD
MWGEFINFLCYVLGYGLGTVNATLPNLPTWGSGTGVIVDPGDGDIPPGSGVLTHPVEPLSVSGYTFNSSHKGVDWGISLRQSVYAAHDGVIDAAGWSEAGYGYKIDISGGSYWSRYAHLDQILVSVGQSVRAGDLIAYGNSTGNSTGNHLHFELRINGVYVNPVLYM